LIASFFNTLSIVSPFLVAFLFSIFLARVAKLEVKRYVLLSFVGIVLSAVVLTPLLSIPIFGVVGGFYLYLSLLKPTDTLFWTYLTMWFRMKRAEHVALISLFITWLAIASTGGATLGSRLLGIEARKGVIFFLSTISLTAITCLLVGWMFSVA